MSPSQAKNQNLNAGKDAAKKLNVVIENIKSRIIPNALEEIGELTIDYSKETKTFRDVTGNLRSGYSYVVIMPNRSGAFVWHSLDGGGSEVISNPDNEILLVYGNGVKYAPIIEMVRGHDVSIQTHLFLRRELKHIFESKLKARKLT
jgi:hypothetical protein